MRIRTYHMFLHPNPIVTTSTYVHSYIHMLIIRLTRHSDVDLRLINQSNQCFPEPCPSLSRNAQMSTAATPTMDPPSEGLEASSLDDLITLVQQHAVNPCNSRISHCVTNRTLMAGSIHWTYKCCLWSSISLALSQDIGFLQWQRPTIMPDYQDHGYLA